MEKWLRNCPVCNSEIVYSSKYTMQSAENKKSLCKICSQKGKKVSDETKKKLSNRGSVFQKEYQKFSENLLLKKLKKLDLKLLMKLLLLRKKLGLFSEEQADFEVVWVTMPKISVKFYYFL